MRPCLVLVGTRPNVMKAAPLVAAFEAAGRLRPVLVHTGQHYDPALSELLFRDLGLREPDHHLGIAGGHPLEQLGRMLPALLEVIEREQPEVLVVVGDVTSTLAGAIAALGTERPVVHVEAGLRSFDRRMPEETNRVLVDAVADLLFCTEPSGITNLVREGRPGERMFLCGNVMIDTLLRLRDRAGERGTCRRHGLEPGGYVLLTAHRPSNVDDAEALTRLRDGLAETARERPVLLPVHPRTRARLESFGLTESFEQTGIRLLDPQPYLDFVSLMIDAALIVTDSGGIQEETTILGKPCLTIRENTERPVTIEQGTNRLVGTDPERLAAACREALADAGRGRAPELWDGEAAVRIERILFAWLDQGLAAAGRAARDCGARPGPPAPSPEGSRRPDVDRRGEASES